MSDLKRFEAVAVRANRPGPWTRWLIGGFIGGGLLGAGHASVILALGGENQRLEIIGLVSGIEGLIASIFAVAYRKFQPKDCSIFTWFGFGIGFLLGVALLMGALENAGSKGPSGNVAAILFAPAMAGLLAGGVIDRICASFLFSYDEQPSE
ncbi:hypothetical protein [Zavarzinella formosa]|uniref:hypothetical protein n=1 Tax=Zavarzinella formosa TaxID=360055 RepID=UPI0012F9B760|nr:hypothetical protein [Zavarzinella formosa]